MKIRTDFVSNSSSSSFIIMDNGAVDCIFRHTRLTWSEYVDMFFDREITDEFLNALNGWGRYGYYKETNFQLKCRIRLLFDDDFIHMYMHEKLPPFALLERDADKVPNLVKLFNKVRKLRSIRENMSVLRNGKEDKYGTNTLDKVLYMHQNTVEDEFMEALRQFKTSMLNVLEPELKDKTFWYAELEDDREDAAEDTMKSYAWYRYFNNH